MNIFLIILGSIAAFWSAFQLQIVSFFPKLGLYTIHKFEQKRWILRIVAIFSWFFLMFYFPIGKLELAISLVSPHIASSFLFYKQHKSF